MSTHESSGPQNKQPRRQFLAAAAIAGTTAAIGPTFVRAADKAGSRLPVLGTGDHAYEATHNWCAPPHISTGATRTAWSSIVPG